VSECGTNGTTGGEAGPTVRPSTAEELDDAVRSTGLHERILNARVDVFGGVAHAFVAFEGFVPGTGEFRSRGLDSIQLLRDRGRWRVVSFTTQYASDASPLPARFLVGG